MFMYHVIVPNIWTFGPLGLCLSRGRQWGRKRTHYLLFSKHYLNSEAPWILTDNFRNPEELQEYVEDDKPPKEKI